MAIMKRALDIYGHIRGWVAEKPWRSTFLVAAFFFGLFFLLYFSVSTLASGDDHFFHFRFAEQLFRSGFFHSFQDFKSIYLSKMAQGNAYFMYYNFLFFLAAMPFALAAPLYLGIKLYAVCAAALAFALLYWCLKRLEVRHPFAWVVVMVAITGTASLWRFFLSRPYALAPSLLLVLLYLLYRRKHGWVAVLSFVYLFWHSSTFFMPAGVALAFYAVGFLFERRPDWKGLAAAVLGTAAAVLATYLVSSGFLSFIWDTLVGIYWQTIIGHKVVLSEGTELYPKDFFGFVHDNAIIFALFLMALVGDIMAYAGMRAAKGAGRAAEAGAYDAGLPHARRHLQAAVLVLTAGFLLGTVAVSARFGDFFAFFAVLSIALSFDYASRSARIEGPRSVRVGIGIGLAVVIVYLTASSLLSLQSGLASQQSALQFYQVGSWLDRNSKPGDVVFEANWSWFPQLYYWSPKDYYTEGLEPRFTYAYSPDLYWKEAHIASDGYVCGQPSCPDLAEKARLALNDPALSAAWARTEGDRIAASLRDEFHARYVVTSTDYGFFNYIMSHNPHFASEAFDSQFHNQVFSVK